MSTRSILNVLLSALVGVLVGCGPTRAGLEARANARERMDLANAQISYDQAHQAFEVGQLDKALRQINIALARYPQSAPYRVLRGRIYLETHRLERALEAFEAALEVDPDFAEAHYFAGICFERWSEDEKAHDRYRSAYELESSNAQYLLAAAEALIGMGDEEAAKQLVEPKLAYFEHNAALRQLLGQIALLQDEPALAVQLYSETRLLNPEDSALLEELAWAQYEAGMYGKCYDSVKQLQGRLTEKRTDLIRLEARCLAFIDRTIEARNLYLELTRLNATDSQCWIELGMLAWELGDDHRVAQCGARALALAPERYEGYMLRAISERQRGDLEAVVSLFEEAAQRASNSAVPHLMLGQALEEIGDREAAFAAYAAGLRAQPDNPEALALVEAFTESAARMLVAEDPAVQHTD